jgi:hypothetical protein
MAASAVAVINETPQVATTRSREIPDAEDKIKGNFTVDKAILDGKLQQFILSVRSNPQRGSIYFVSLII